LAAFLVKNKENGFNPREKRINSKEPERKAQTGQTCYFCEFSRTERGWNRGDQSEFIKEPVRISGSQEDPA
jgi:hypothetical protein